MRRVLVDTGALVALVRQRDALHQGVSAFFGSFRDGELVTTTPVLTETLHLLPSRLGPGVLQFLAPPLWQVLDTAQGLERIAELLVKYADLPMDFADASLVWAAERTGIREVLTTDREFDIYRTRDRRRLERIPI